MQNFENPKKLLNDEYLMKLRELARKLQAQNLSQTHKKKMLAEYRENIFNNLKNLQDCKNKLLLIKTNYD